MSGFFINDQNRLNRRREEHEWRSSRPKDEKEIDLRGGWKGGLISWEAAKEFATRKLEHNLCVAVEKHEDIGLSSADDNFKRITISGDDWSVMVEQTDSHPYFPDPDLPDDLKFGDEAPYCFPWPVRQWTYENISRYRSWSAPLERKLREQEEEARLDAIEQERHQKEAAENSRLQEERADRRERRKGFLTLIAFATGVIALIWNAL